MFVILEDHDDFETVLGVTDDEATAQEMILALSQERLYHHFYKKLHSSYSNPISVTEIINSYLKCSLKSFSWDFRYEEVPFIH